MISKEKSIILQCLHKSKKFRLKFRCERTGDYIIELCEGCRDNETKEFLIEEEQM